MKKRVLTLLAVLPFFLVFLCLGGTFTHAMPAGLHDQEYFGGTHSRSYDSTLAPEAVPSRWVTETMDASTSNVGQNVSLAWGSNDIGYAAYYDAINGQLIYARQYYDIYGNRYWETVPIRSSASFPSLTLDGNNNPYIAYKKLQTGPPDADLEIAWHDLSGWHYKLEDRGSWEAEGTSIVYDAGYVYVSYYDRDNEDLLFVRDNLGVFPPFPTIVDNAAGVGRYSSIAMRSDGQPRIVYSDEAGHQLKYASTSNYGDTWTKGTLFDDQGDGQYNSLAIGSGDTPYISYFDNSNSNNDLRFASWSLFFGWNSTLVDTDWAGAPSSLALDSAGRPAIAYHSYNNGLMFAERLANGSWSTEMVDNDINAGQFVSLAFDQSGQPHIAYYNGTSGHLNHAFRKSVIFLPLVVR
jgi:hypothetical protein